MPALIRVGGGTDGLGTLGATIGAAVQLRDVGSGTPNSRTWSVERWPSPDATAPPLEPGVDSSIVTLTPTTDGLYQVKLARAETDGSQTSYEVLVGVRDADGLVLPSRGVSDELFSRLSAVPAEQVAAKLAGWAGSLTGATHVLLDAFLRSMRLKINAVTGSAVYTCGAGDVAGQWVSVSGNDTVTPVDAGSGVARGVIAEKFTATSARVVTAGEVACPGGLVAGETYYLSRVSGAMITRTALLAGDPGAPQAGDVWQILGWARNTTTFVVALQVVSTE